MRSVDRTRLPALAPEPPYAFPLAAKRRLDSGLGLWTVERHGLPIVSLVLLLPAGSAWDPPDKPGLAAMTADMLDEGAGGRSAMEIQEALARIGTALDTEIGPDSLVLSLTLLDRFVPAGLRLLADVAVRPGMAAADFERVRELRANRIRQLRDVPSVNAEAVLLRTLYGPHPYGHLTLGSAASLDGFEPADATGFHRSYADPARATLIAVGAITPDAFAREVDEAFRGWSSGGQADTLTPAAPASRPQPRLLLVDRPGAAQTELRVGHVGVPRRTDAYYPLVVANAVLGGQFTSRLNLNLRERMGCTYGVRSGFDFRRAAGPFSVQTSVQTSATADAVGQILEEVAAIRGPRPAAGDELELAAATLTKGYPGNFETSGQVARALSHLALHDLPDDSFAQFARRIREVTPEAATAAARDCIDPDSAVVVAIGDSERIRGGLEALGLGDAVATTSGL